MKNRPIQLTEQDLHMLVEDAVRAYLVNEGMDEGFWGGLGALGSKFGNKAATAGQNLANSAGQKWNQAKNAVGNAYNSAANAVGNAYNSAANSVGNAYNNAKNTYQTGSANQDAQKAIQNAVQALNNLKAADQKLQSMGQYSVIGKQVGLIDNLLRALNQGGATSMSGRFQNRRNAFTH